jgi:hypothetical protein
MVFSSAFWTFSDSFGHSATFCDRKRRGKYPLRNQYDKKGLKHKQQQNRGYRKNRTAKKNNASFQMERKGVVKACLVF